jgi:hypothetical protein
VNAFHVLGGLLALWALLVAFLGITREEFPGEGGEKVVAAISIFLVAAAISAAVVTAANEEEEHEGGEGAAVLPL